MQYMDPIHPFTSFDNCLELSDRMMARTLKDCEATFTARAGNQDKYSEGSTFWLPRSAAPSCLLEQVAQSTFDHYTAGLDFDPESSGAEWWTLVIDVADDVGFHWDKDYYLEAEEGVNLCPRVATVTYLSDAGAPTLVLDCHCPPNAGDTCCGGSIGQGWFSHPRRGKQMSYDGRLLHGSPEILAGDILEA